LVTAFGAISQKPKVEHIEEACEPLAVSTRLLVLLRRFRRSGLGVSTAFPFLEGSPSLTDPSGGLRGFVFGSAFLHG
jgi:hypothetical protein